MRTHSSLILALFLAISALPNPAQAQANPNSNPAPSPPTAESDGPSWLFPVAKLDEVLPRWFHIGGEYRDRLEGPIGTGFANTSDFYVLDRLRVKITIQPKDWLKFYGEVQDARIFFNHHIPNANPFEDTWTLWQAYVQVGSSTSGWVDALAGRKVLLFGDERVSALLALDATVARRSQADAARSPGLYTRLTVRRHSNRDSHRRVRAIRGRHLSAF